MKYWQPQTTAERDAIMATYQPVVVYDCRTYLELDDIQATGTIQLDGLRVRWSYYQPWNTKQRRVSVKKKDWRLRFDAELIRFAIMERLTKGEN